MRTLLTGLGLMLALAAPAFAQTKPGLVLLPIQGIGMSAIDKDQYRAALASSLSAKYEVFSGDEVDKKLEKFAKKTCDAEKCLQEMAIAYQASLIARGIIAKEPDGYVITIEIRDIFSDKVELSDTKGCSGCGRIGLIEALKALAATSAPVVLAAPPAVAEAPKKPARTGPVDDQTALWEAVQQGNTADDYDAYLGQYPKGKFVALAKSRKAKLEKDAQEAKAQAEQEAWQAAQTSNTPESYGAYLKTWPTGKFAQLAGTRQKKLQDDQVFLKEKAAWDAAQATGTSDGLNAYLKAYPAGRYVAAAEARRKTLVEEAAAREEQAIWQAAEKSQDKAQVQGYLKRYPAGRFITQAETQLAAILKEEADMRPGKIVKGCADCPEVVLLPAGRFEMGSNENSNEKPIHTVNVPAFFMGKTEVTQAQWQALMGSNPSYFKNCDTCPVENVSWDDIQSYLQKLNAKTGKQYRLPSEAEWEYACRAGGTHTYCGGNDLNSVAWTSRNSGTKTHPVGEKQANAFGLYDMSGNVWEWVQDCWNGSYSGAPTDGKAWMGGDCGQRVLRGGSWSDLPQFARSALRDGDSAGGRNGSSGFRVAAPFARTN